MKGNCMPQKQVYYNCKYFDFPTCPYLDDKLMVIARQKIPIRPIKTNRQPFDPDVEKLCEKCETFTQR